MQTDTDYKFLTESTLGKLAKYLRMAGFDTLHDKTRPDPLRLVAAARAQGRILLSRTRCVVRATAPVKTLFIRYNNTNDQFAQVMADLSIKKHALRPLTRCMRCNFLLVSCEKDAVRGRVPDHILQTHDHFRTCPGCGKVYWPGTHAERMKARLQKIIQLFPDGD